MTTSRPTSPANYKTWTILALFGSLLAGLGLALHSGSETAVPTNPAATRHETRELTSTTSAQGEQRRRTDDEIVAETSGFYSAPAGQVMQFDYRAATKVKLVHTENAAAGATVELELEGDMVIAVLARKADELIIDLSFPETTARAVSNGSELPVGSDEAMIIDLARSCLVRMRDDGATLGYAFDAEMTPKSRNLIRGLWSSARFVASTAIGQPWTTVEDDAVGPADIEYRWVKPIIESGLATGGRLARKKLGYSGDRQAEVGAITANGDGEAHLNPSVGWFELAHGQEFVRREMDAMQIVMESTMTSQWQLRDVDWQAVENGDGLWDTNWQPLGGDQESSLADSSNSLQYHRQQLANVSLEQLLGDIAALLLADGDPHEIYGKKFDLTKLLQIRPEALAKLHSMLPQLDPRTAGLAISAIAATQTAAAQSIIGQLYSDLTQPLANRKSAAWAMIQVEQPTPEVVSAFAAAVRSATAHGPDVAAGILALGTMLGRTDPATQQLAMATLLDLESTAHANGATVNWLEALGNSGMPAALEAARRFHNHENVGIRVAAVSAVRAVEGAAALAVAVAALQDPTAAVRIRAAQVVIGRAEPQAGNVINAFLLNEPNRFVRGSVLEALAGRLPDPNALALIQRSANSDPDAEVRQLATRMLP